MTGWRQFWRQLRRRNGWGRRWPWFAIRFIEVPRPAAPGQAGPDPRGPNPEESDPAGSQPGGRAVDGRGGDVRAGDVRVRGSLFPGAPRPAEPLPARRQGEGRPPVTPKPAQLAAQFGRGGESRRETLQALVEALGVRPADPAEAEAYLRAWLELSSRQQQVVGLVCAGHTNHEIAKRLRLSPNTVKSHLALALRRFGLRSRTELRVALASWDFSRLIDFHKPDR